MGWMAKLSDMATAGLRGMTVVPVKLKDAVSFSAAAGVGTAWLGDQGELSRPSALCPDSPGQKERTLSK